jgi:hypothetical protein
MQDAAVSIRPGYNRQQPIQRPKLEAWIGIIDQILEEDTDTVGQTAA